MKNRNQIQAECLEVILPKKRCGVGITMGVGKTLIGLRHMSHNYSDFAKFLVVAPKKTIIQAWKDEAAKHRMEYLLPHITFSTYLSLTKQDLDHDVVYLDECHSLKEDSHDPWLSQYKGKILGLTGTPPKYKNSEKGRMVNRYCPIIYTYIVNEAVSDGILNNVTIRVHLLKLSLTRNMPITRGGNTWFNSEQSDYNYWSRRIDAAVTGKEVQIARIMRMKAMKEYPTKEKYAKLLLENSKVKTILFANTQEQADRMCEHSYHSNNPQSDKNLEEFKSGEITKLSSVLQLSEGVNIPNLKVGIIMHAYGNERKSSQRIGRLMRLSPKDVSMVHILCYADTVDQIWVKDALEGFDSSRIHWNLVKTS